MADMTPAAAERLLLLMAGYQRAATSAMAEVASDAELVNHACVVVLCTLDVDGPRRPGELQDVTGLSSGGVSKLLDRMEQAGVVKRTYGGVPGDNRGVVVSFTRRGRAVVGRLAAAAADRLPDTRTLVKELSTALEG